MIKRFFITLICLNLAFYAPFANALSFGNWTKTFSKSYGSTTALGFRSAGTVSPSNPAGLLYSGVSVKANPSALAKLFKKVGPTAGFTLAVGALLGAVDYVLDPANNQILYEPPIDPNEPFAEYFPLKPTNATGFNDYILYSLQEVKDHAIEAIDTVYSDKSGPTELSHCIDYYFESSPFFRITCHVNYHDRGRSGYTRTINYQPAPKEPKSLGYEDIGAEVINQADQGVSSAQKDTKAAADPDGWTAPTYPYGNLEPEIEANKKEAECDPRKDVENSCYGKVGSPLKADPDGVVEVINPDGSTTKYFPDGSVETSNPVDGTTTKTYPDGTKTRTAPDGTSITTKPDGTITNDPDPMGGVEVRDPDGTSVIAAPDGSITKYFPDGSKKTIQPDGTTRTTKPDGTVTIEAPNGDTVTIAPDGTKTTTKPDGKKEVDTDFKLPKFCDWAFVVCDFIDVVMEQFEEPDLPEREAEEEQEEEFEEKEVEVDFTEGCPANKEFAFGILGFNKTFTFEFKPICDGAIYLNPILQSIGALSAAYIMFGRPLK